MFAGALPRSRLHSTPKSPEANLPSPVGSFEPAVCASAQTGDNRSTASSSQGPNIEQCEDRHGPLRRLPAALACNPTKAVANPGATLHCAALESRSMPAGKTSGTAPIRKPSKALAKPGKLSGTAVPAKAPSKAPRHAAAKATTTAPGKAASRAPGKALRTASLQHSTTPSTTSKAASEVPCQPGRPAQRVAAQVHTAEHLISVSSTSCLTVSPKHAAVSSGSVARPNASSSAKLDAEHVTHLWKGKEVPDRTVSAAVAKLRQRQQRKASTSGPSEHELDLEGSMEAELLRATDSDRTKQHACGNL